MLKQKKKDVINARVFIDMDGVLAKWAPVDFYEQLFEKGRFDSLPVQQWVIDGLLGASQLFPKLRIKKNGEIQEVNVEYYVLTSCVDSPYAIPEKSYWLDKEFNLPAHRRIYVKNGDNKADYVPGGVKPTDILIDDYSVNLHRWTKRGGQGIKLMNGDNGNYGTWMGKMIKRYSRPEDFFNIITETIIENLK